MLLLLLFTAAIAFFVDSTDVQALYVVLGTVNLSLFVVGIVLAGQQARGAAILPVAAW